MCIKWYIYDPFGESDLIFVYMMHIIHAFLTCDPLYLIKQRLFALENDFLPFLWWSSCFLIFDYFFTLFSITTQQRYQILKISNRKLSLKALTESFWIKCLHMTTLNDHLRRNFILYIEIKPYIACLHS
jgi:hypothetical protein